MEVPRLVHDTLLHELHEPQERALVADVARVTDGAVEIVVSDDESSSKDFQASESTPLLMAGTHHVKLTKELDLKALALRLDEEERAAVLSDHTASARSILMEESKTLFALAVPLILASIMEFLPDMVVTMLLGHSDPVRSTQILAANSLNGLIQLLLVGTVLTGVSSAVDTLGAQAFGAKRLSELWLFVQAGFIVYLGFWPFVSLVLLNSHRVPGCAGPGPRHLGDGRQDSVCRVSRVPVHGVICASQELAAGPKHCAAFDCGHRRVVGIQPSCRVLPWLLHVALVHWNCGLDSRE
ncbi:hypothetical protein PINS_up006354 [Pythium insidiosum]|nr:hypothetical protein PINS_up006354 [Pythium insidiosum]